MRYALLAGATVSAISEAGPRGADWVAVPADVMPGWRCDGLKFAALDVAPGDSLAAARQIVGGVWIDTTAEQIAAQPVPPIRATRMQLVRTLRKLGLAEAFAAGLSKLPQEAQEDWSLAVEITSSDPLALMMAEGLGVDVMQVFKEARR